MVWACFSWAGKSELVLIEGNVDSSRYCATLGTTLLPFIEHHHPNGAIFQQDNAYCHTSVYTKDWFVDMDVDVLDWPVRSPDQNPIENLWGMLGRAVYSNGRQFESFGDLKEALVFAWDNIDKNVLRNLVTSMATRVVPLIEAKGGRTSY